MLDDCKQTTKYVLLTPQFSFSSFPHHNQKNMENKTEWVYTDGKNDLEKSVLFCHRIFLQYHR